jgi:hypothetical protein
VDGTCAEGMIQTICPEVPAGARKCPSVSVHTRANWLGSSRPWAGGTTNTREIPRDPPSPRNQVLSSIGVRRSRLDPEVAEEPLGASLVTSALITPATVRPSRAFPPRRSQDQAAPGGRQSSHGPTERLPDGTALGSKFDGTPGRAVPLLGRAGRPSSSRLRAQGAQSPDVMLGRSTGVCGRRTRVKSGPIPWFGSSPPAGRRCNGSVVSHFRRGAGDRTASPGQTLGGSEDFRLYGIRSILRKVQVWINAEEQ